MPKAYVLISATHSRIDAIRDELRALKPPVTEADMIMGPYDLIAVVEGADVNEIGRLVIRQIQKIDGVERTLTCMVIGAESEK